MANPVGRPPVYDDPQILQSQIDRYFKEGVTKKQVVIGKAPKQQVIEIEIPTISGLCYFLGFESRQSFYAYEKKEEFSYTIRKARLFIEKHYEEMLQQGNTIGAIFALKNFDWKDKQETEHSGQINWDLTMNINGANKLHTALDAGVPKTDN